MAKGKKKYGYLATIGADTSGLTEALQEVDTAIGKTSGELKEINKALKLDPGNAELLTQKQDALNRQLEATTEKMNKLEAKRSDMDKAFSNNAVWEKAYEPLNKSLEEAEKKLADLKAQNEQMENDLNSGAITQTVYDEYTKQITEAKNEQKNFRKQIKELDEEIQKQGGRINADEYRQYKLELGRTEAQAASLRAELKKQVNSFNNAEKSVKEYDDTLENANQTTVKFSDMAIAHAVGDLIADGFRRAASAVGDFIKNGIELASNLTEVQNVVDVTFGDGAQEVYDWADAAAESFGMSSLAAQEYNGTMGAMLKSMGLTDNAVRQMSMDMVGLAGDMASFYNLDVETAFQKIRSGISGETEPLKQLGINMSVANLEAYALAQGIETAYSKMTEAEKATLRYNYLMAQTADAQGDFARTSDSFANQQRILELQVQNLAASFGEKLLPSLNNVFQTANDKLPKLENSVENIGTVLGKVTEFAIDHNEAILSLITAYATFSGAKKAGTFVMELAGAFKSLTPATQAATAAQEANNAAVAANPYVLAVAALAALTIGLVTYANSVDSVHNSIKSVNNEIKELKKNTDESVANTEAEIAVFKDKAEQYEELREKANRTAGEEERLAQLAEELQQYMPEGTQLIDEQTGAYNSLADSIDNVAEAMKRRATIAAYEEEYTELVKQQLEAQKNLESAQERLKEFTENGGKISANPFQNAAFSSMKKDFDDAAETLINIEERKNELDSAISKLYEQEPVRETEASETYSEYMQRVGEQQYEENQKQRAEELADYENSLKAKREALDNDLALRRISEEDYYNQLGSWLEENRNLSSKEYFSALGDYESYLDKKQTAAEKAAEEEQKAEKERQNAAKKAAEDAETEQVNAIKAYWDNITKMRDFDKIDDETEYKLKAQIVKKYCDENEDTWDSYYKWLYDYTKNQEQEIADARLEAWEDSSKELADTLAESYKDLKSQKEQVKKDLQSISLTETVKDKNGNEVLGIKSLDAEIAKIDKLKASRDKLKETGISDSLLAEIDKMNYADGSRQLYIDELLGLSPDVLKEYYADWEMLRNKQEEFAQDTIKDKLDETNQAAAEGVSDIFGKIPEEAYNDGIKTAQQYLQGIIDGMNGVNDVNAISGILNSAYNYTSDSLSQNKNSVGKSTANETVLASTPIYINLNDKAYINTTVGDLMKNGKRTGGNTFSI